MNYIFHNTHHHNEGKKRKAEMLQISILVSLIFHILYLIVTIYSGFVHATILVIISTVSVLASLVLLNTPVKLKIPGNISVASTNFLAFSCIYFSGGIHSPILIWLISPPIIALLVLNKASSYAWVVITLTEIAVLVYFDWQKFVIDTSYNRMYDDFFYFSSFVGVMIVVFIISTLFENSFVKSQKSVEKLNQALLMKNEEMNVQTEEIVSQRDMLFEMTKEMETQKEEVIQLNEQLEERIKRRTNELFGAMDELDTFIYRSAHDIKGPLATISGLCYVAMFDVKDEKSAGYLAKIQIQTQKTIQLLQRISGISELKKTAPVASIIDFELINQKIIKYLQEEEDSQFVKINVKLPNNEIEFCSDQHLIEMAVIDLIDNAIKFRDSFKTDAPFANLQIAVTGAYLHIQMEDNGIGIPDNLKTQVFEMFFKGSDKSKGSGLGLFIVKIILDKLHGKIILDNTNKAKTIFNLEIPSLIPLANYRKLKYQV